MSEIRVNVEGAPEAVAKFFKEMGQTHFVGVDEARVGCESTSFIEVSPEVDEPVEICPVEVYQIKNEKKPSRKPRQKKTEDMTIEPEVVENETPDPEFADLPDVDVAPSENIVMEGKYKCDVDFDNLPKAENLEPSEIKKLKIQDVKEALKEYGIWIVEQGHESASAKEYLIALLRKFGNGVTATADLSEEYYEAVFQAAVNRVPKEELEEYK